MSVKLYDEALVNKFKNVFNNTIYSPVDRAFLNSAKKNKRENGVDKPSLPLISIYRENFTISLDFRDFSHPRRGRRDKFKDFESHEGYDNEEVPTSIQKIMSLPIRIDYQVDIWTKEREQLDVLTVELLFWLIRNPVITVDPPNIDTEEGYDFQLQLWDDLVDNTDLMQTEDLGRIYRITVPLYIDNARVFSVYDIKTVLEGEVTFLDIEGEELESFIVRREDILDNS